MPRIRELFWSDVLLQISHLILNFEKEARKNSLLLEGIINPIFFNQLLKPIEKGAEFAISEHLKTKEFLNSYSKK